MIRLWFLRSLGPHMTSSAANQATTPMTPREVTPAVADQAVPAKSLTDPSIKKAIQELRQPDDFTNWLYLARTYLYLAAVIGATVWFFHANAQSGWGFWWNLPITFVAVILVGAGMHQLTALTHEASHFSLFRNRWTNELVSEFFCMYPLFSATHLYRLQHVAHHQFVNDPHRDPDLAQLQESGHWIGNPAPRGAFMRMLFRQIWIPNIVKFMLARAKFNAVGTEKNPYFPEGMVISKTPKRIGIAYLLGMVAILALANFGNWPYLLWAGPAVLTFLMVARVLSLKPDQFIVTRIAPVVPAKISMLCRLSLNGLIFTVLGLLCFYVDPWAPAYYALLWVLPIFTSFGLFMMLRQVVQHGNADRGWITNTRVFLLNQAYRFAVFPLGQDYHLPHHMYASVPHYRLKKLHEVLMQCPEYAAEATEVHGYFHSPENPKVRPTVVDVLGPDWSPRTEHEAFLDHAILDNMEVTEKEKIIQG